MIALTRLKQLNCICKQCYCTVLHRERFRATPNSNLSIKLPFNISVKALNPLDTQEHDWLSVNIISDRPIKTAKKDFMCLRKGENIVVFGRECGPSYNALCEVDSPATMNVVAHSLRGNVSVKGLHNTQLNLQTGQGSITTTRCISDKITLTSESGDITCEKLLQASSIALRCAGSGNIITQKLQANELSIQVHQGLIKASAIYANESTVSLHNGQVQLKNVHSNCRVDVVNEGDVNIMGLDGSVNLTLNKGSAEVQIVQILANSEITLVGEGVVRLKIYDKAQENTCYKIMAWNCRVEDDFPMTATNTTDSVILKPRETSPTFTVLVMCQSGTVFVEHVPLFELFNLTLPK